MNTGIISIKIVAIHVENLYLLLCNATTVPEALQYMYVIK